MTATGATMEVAVNSGSVLRRLELLAAEAQARGVRTHGDLENRSGKLSQIAEERLRQETRAIQHRAECRERMRKANRDEKASTAATCFSEALSQELTLLHKERLLITSFRFLSEDLRAPALHHTEELIEAVEAVIGGIDAKIYSEIPDLEDAKSRLHVKYRLPRMATLLPLEADMDRAWNALFAMHLRDRVRDDSTLLEPLQPLADAVSCLETQQSAWVGLTPSLTYLEIKSKLSQFQSDQAECIRLIRNVNGTLPAPPPEPAPEAS